VPETEKAKAKTKFFAAVRRVGSSIDDALKNELSRASFADSVVDLEEMPIFVVSFPQNSSLSGFHFAFTVDHLLHASEEELAAELSEYMKRQLDERKAELPWWKRVFRR